VRERGCTVRDEVIEKEEDIMAASSSATTVWRGGGLADGSGVTTPGSHAFPPTEVSWARRIEPAAGKTNPEELLAAAHASCYCMQFSHLLDQAGNPPEELEAKATVVFVPGEGVKSSHIEVSGQVPGLDQDAFAAVAADAGKTCPISGALSIPITVDATLLAS
jgi:osmotically inducible protein OsmC